MSSVDSHQSTTSDEAPSQAHVWVYLTRKEDNIPSFIGLKGHELISRVSLYPIEKWQFVLDAAQNTNDLALRASPEIIDCVLYRVFHPKNVAAKWISQPPNGMMDGPELFVLEKKFTDGCKKHSRQRIACVWFSYFVQGLECVVYDPTTGKQIFTILPKMTEISGSQILPYLRCLIKEQLHVTEVKVIEEAHKFNKRLTSAFVEETDIIPRTV